MAKTLSQDLRSRLIQAVNDGMSRRDAAELFSVGVATAIRWVAEWHATGATRAKPKDGDRRSHRVETHGAFILAAVDARVDISLAELCEMLRKEHGVHFSTSTIWRFLDRRGLTFKKNRARGGTGTPRYSRAAREMVRGPARP